MPQAADNCKREEKQAIARFPKRANFYQGRGKASPLLQAVTSTQTEHWQTYQHKSTLPSTSPSTPGLLNSASAFSIQQRTIQNLQRK